MFKVILKIIFKPKEFFKGDIYKVYSLPFLIFYMLILNSIGPFLSLYSMHVKEKIPLSQALLYSISTFFLDIFSIAIFAFFLYKKTDKDLYTAFKVSLFIYTPIWLSDFVDISQILRPLSSLGFIYSLYLLYLWLKLSSLRGIPLYMVFFTILYLLDAYIAELIVQSPVVKYFLK